MLRFHVIVSASLFFTACSLYAKPVIEFDTKEYDCGSFVDGTKDKIEAVFTVKNTGDENLKLITVRPSCGCTVVKFDSLIQPGQSTKINSTVNIKGKKGALSKLITVTSNAENDSNTRLVIKATIVEVLSSSISFIDMTGENQKVKTSLQLTTPKKDLKISDLSFIPKVVSKADGTPAATNPAKVTFSLVSMDTARTDGLITYRLEIEPVALSEPAEGEFVIINNSDNKELRIRGKVGSK